MAYRLPLSVDVLNSEGTVRLPPGTTAIPLEFQLRDANDDPIDLGDASRATITIREYGGDAELLSRPVEMVDREAGRVRHEWRRGETDTPGTYAATLGVHYTDGRELTAPSEFPVRIIIEAVE